MSDLTRPYPHEPNGKKPEIGPVQLEHYVLNHLEDVEAARVDAPPLNAKELSLRTRRRLLSIADVATGFIAEIPLAAWRALRGSSAVGGGAK